MERLGQLQNNLCENKHIENKSYEKSEWFKLAGWGYKDTQFEKHRDGIARLSGNKYGVAGEKLVNFIPWVETNLGLDTSITPLKGKDTVTVSQANLNTDFMKAISAFIQEIVIDDRLRAFHSRG
jgi:hypothetical protein